VPGTSYFSLELLSFATELRDKFKELARATKLAGTNSSNQSSSANVHSQLLEALSVLKLEE